jgi:molybdopterin synthase catalytic subunit
MRRELTLTDAALDEAALVRARTAPAGMGAVVTFAGLVRGSEAGAAIRALEYEAFRAMAERQFHLLFDALAERWPAVESVRLVHRLGVVAVGEASLWVEVVAPHRAEAFAAGQWLIDEMKRVVPIWKRAVA